MKTLIISLSCIIGFGACVLFIGCETESATQQQITISPASATISMGQSITFTASGWNEYVWSISNPEWGTLSSQVGNTTVYTSIRGDSLTNEVSNALQTLTVSAPNGTGVVFSATALITHN